MPLIEPAPIPFYGTRDAWLDAFALALGKSCPDLSQDECIKAAGAQYEVDASLEPRISASLHAQLDRGGFERDVAAIRALRADA